MTESADIVKVLGKGNPPLLIIACAIMTLTLFFYIFTVGSYFHVGVSPLENRVNYHKSFQVYLINKDIDHIVIVTGTGLWLALSLLGKLKVVSSAGYFGLTVFAIWYHSWVLDIATLISIPVVVSFLVYNRFTSRKILITHRALTINYFAILGIATGLISSAISLAPLFSISQKSIPVQDFAYEIFVLLSSFSAVLIFILIMGSTVKLLIGKSIAKISSVQKNFFVSDTEKKSRNTILYLLLIMLFSIALSLVPHQPSINSDNQEVGSDSGDYVSMLRNLMSAKDSSEFIRQAFVVQGSGDRPLALIFLYAFAKTIPANLSFTVDHSLVILAPALVLSVFVLTRELTSNDKMSLFAAFVTAVSFQTLIGMYGGLYANLFALAVGYLSLVFLLRFLKNSGKLNLITYLLLMVALLLSHVYTWTVLTLVMSVFLALMYKLNYYDKKRILFIFLVILLTVAIDVSRTVITNVQGGISQDITLAGQDTGLRLFVPSWNNLIDTMQNFSGGQFGNFIILILGLYWLIRANLRELPNNILLAVFLAMGTLPLLFGSDLIQSRVFYNIPFQIPAGITLAYLNRRVNGIIIVIPVCIWLLVMSVKAVSNFYYISP